MHFSKLILSAVSALSLGGMMLGNSGQIVAAERPNITYPQHSWYFHPHIRLMNQGNQAFQWWTNTPATIQSFGPGTYGPDVELDFIFDFMDKQHAKDEPFFVYHTTHLGHGAFDWLKPENGQSWPGTPKIQWDGKAYKRTAPHITGDDGDYDTHGTVTESGIHTHINYLDYHLWRTFNHATNGHADSKPGHFSSLVVDKLGQMVLGDGRVEADGTRKNSFAVSEFAAVARDGKLDIPARSIPRSRGEVAATAPDLKIEFGPVSRNSIFTSETWSHWGGSVVRGKDGRYHMLYSRWPKKLGWAWVTDSEIAHATATSPLGPFQHAGIALSRRGKELWDGWCTHNPTVHKFGDKYYLYYMGNTGDGKVVGHPGKQLLNWQHRNNQRIGVAVANSPAGPWTRRDTPVLDISKDVSAGDALMTSNPSVCQRPDGKILMVYKAVGKEFPMPNGGPVVHRVAISYSPTGPFKKLPNPVFTFAGERFPAEDPTIWFQDGKFRAIVKRIKQIERKRVFSLVHYDSVNGIDWQPAKYHEISDRTVTWESGTTEQFDHLERPQVVVEDGVPVALICAADRIDKNKVRHSFNIQIPLVVTKD